MSHDQNFKNLILDYPLAALQFFAAAEADAVNEQVHILPLREEQLQERLGERFRELDVPLLVEWPDGRRGALLFVLEEETEGRRFSIHRLAHYCLDLAELLQTERIVPVVIFLRAGEHPADLVLGGDRCQYLAFRYLACHLYDLNWQDWRNSDNLVARLNLPNMRYADAERVAVYAAALRGLLDLEPDPERRLKYLGFVDIYTGLTDAERDQYRRDYPEENATMVSFQTRFEQIGEQRGIQIGEQRGIQIGEQRGEQRGKANLLLDLLETRFGPVPEEFRARIGQADAALLSHWSRRLLTADSIEAVFE
jgi:hypothetical protein